MQDLQQAGGDFRFMHTYQPCCLRLGVTCSSRGERTLLCGRLFWSCLMVMNWIVLMLLHPLLSVGLFCFFFHRSLKTVQAFLENKIIIHTFPPDNSQFSLFLGLFLLFFSPCPVIRYLYHSGSLCMETASYISWHEPVQGFVTCLCEI